MNEYSVKQSFAVKRARRGDEQIGVLLDHLAGQRAVIARGPVSGLIVRISVDAADSLTAHQIASGLIRAALVKSGIVFEGPEDSIETEITTAERLEERNNEPPEEYVGASELAALLGVTRQRASALAASSTFPAPVARLASGPVWKKSSVGRFVDEWERRPGRPRKKEAV
ncbi:MAG: hypothetical protein WD739_07440 [Actinomycetota bacterium]